MVVMDASQTMASKACELCQSLIFFSNQHGLAFVEIDLGDYCMTLEVRGRFFKKWLQHNFYKAYAKPISETVMGEALSSLEAKALFEGGKKETYLRTAYVNGKIYIDLGRDSWEVVEIDDGGYRILNRSPVAFIRKEGMSAMPSPKGNAPIGNFLHINVSESQLKLILAWILGAFRGKPPYPILILAGEQGSGKSTLTEILRRIVDPSVVPLRGISTASDLVITAASSHLIVMDNAEPVNESETQILIN